MVISFLKSQKYFLFILFLISLLARFIFFEFFLKDTNKLNNHDSMEYHDIALQLVARHGFSFSTALIRMDGRVYGDVREITKDPYVPNFFRLPGYPLFLAACYKLLGQDPDSAIKIQIFFSSFIPILIFYLALILFPTSFLLAKLVSVFSAFYLGFLLYSGVLLTESIFLIFLLLFLIFFLNSFSLFFCGSAKFSFSKIFFAGFFLGIASLIRPVGHYLIVASVFLFLFSSFDFITKIKGSFSLLIGWFAVVFWWLLRNFILSGYVFFHTLPGPHFLNYITSHIYMRIYNCDWSTASEKLRNEWRKQIQAEGNKIGRQLNEIECCKLAENISKKYWLQEPVMFLKFCFYNIYRTVTDLHSHPFFIDLKNYSIFWLILLWFLNCFYYLMLFGFVGFVFLSIFNFDCFCCLCKVLPFVSLFVFITLATGFSRVRLPIEPFLIILSFRFWIDLCGRKRKRFLWKTNKSEKV